MKRYLTLLLTCTILLTCSLPVLAVNNITPTEEFICYFDDDCYVEKSILYYENSLVVTKKITFEGTVTPGRTIEHMQTRDGITYRGTLSLISCQYQDNKTIAVYKGTLYPVA